MKEKGKKKEKEAKRIRESETERKRKKTKRESKRDQTESVGVIHDMKDSFGITWFAITVGVCHHSL